MGKKVLIYPFVCLCLMISEILWSQPKRMLNVVLFCVRVCSEWLINYSCLAWVFTMSCFFFVIASNSNLRQYLCARARERKSFFSFANLTSKVDVRKCAHLKASRLQRKIAMSLSIWIAFLFPAFRRVQFKRTHDEWQKTATKNSDKKNQSVMREFRYVQSTFLRCFLRIIA